LTGWHQPDTFRYPTLDEAKKFCLMFPERYCRGITDEWNAGNIFSIRIGDQAIDSNSGETSYIRSNCEEEIEHTKDQNLMEFPFCLKIYYRMISLETQTKTCVNEIRQIVKGLFKNKRG